ncbi:type II toxin-antitoxin system RelE/ParE family toxin [Marinimicrobium sp. ABcell2]|uniref:type II toxin-antitoxin system RelE/ParE family toxin n=1 Tax=Marinimicrobium sp. ABcell2 TaxID=3069751 RepID=UPI0027B601EF|nr:type II toxin-antitoxin system RelE/ParE family toxin [Marinimicrobium sp. ABcell2]MDQ2075477.1 type II toxin-antitoxin system RelE/ParE family toxin [Marinimicrobium sp. ABcell2]
MVIWSHPAKADLKHIHDFIAEDSRHYAKKVAQEIREKADSLSELPSIGKAVAEIGKPYIRELPIYSYRIIYEVTDQHIYVLAVIHKRRDFKAEDLP